MAAHPTAAAAGAALRGATYASRHAPPCPAGLSLEIPVRLSASDGLATPFTNYVEGYKGLLDYIW